MIDFNRVENTSGRAACRRARTRDGNLLPSPSDEDEEDTVRFKVKAHNIQDDRKGRRFLQEFSGIFYLILFKGGKEQTTKERVGAMQMSQ